MGGGGKGQSVVASGISFPHSPLPQALMVPNGFEAWPIPLVGVQLWLTAHSFPGPQTTRPVLMSPRPRGTQPRASGASFMSVDQAWGREWWLLGYRYTLGS